jgi:uncharacterized protein YaaR (DUF327 family)
MAKVDFPPDLQGVFPDSGFPVNPNIRAKTGERRSRRISGKKSDFSSIMEQSRTAGLEALDLPPLSTETTNRLMEDVRDAGDALRERPFPQEILAYKQAVRNFMRYVVDNNYLVEDHQGIYKYKDNRHSPDSRYSTMYHTVQVVDRRLEELAAALLKGQLSQLETLSRLEEIKGLLVDLVS